MSEFVEYLTEVFRNFGVVRSRRMFGGYGIYHDNLMFGLVADDVLYLKVDDQSVTHFEDNGLRPFKYSKNGKSMRMSYYMAPEDIYDDPDVARDWAQLAFTAALRSRKPAKGPKKAD